MMRTALLCAMAATASAFAPSAMLPATARSGAVSRGPSMQLFQDGKLQGKGLVAIPPLGRPETECFDGTWAGDVGFDPLCISGYLDVKWLREAELKHCRVAMLATAGCIAQDLFKFPGVDKVQPATQFSPLTASPFSSRLAPVPHSTRNPWFTRHSSP
mmetsp:Transcript_11989/g.18779  ORF Transcript_11989/g.18779 Transcript_11989/m.18779 type:complete len:158 (+) Transcript_11989:2-475(+)